MNLFFKIFAMISCFQPIYNTNIEAPINSPCRERIDCPKNGYMCDRNRTCQCNHLFLPNMDGTKCVGGIKQPCMYDNDCIERAYCKNQVECHCKLPYLPSEDGLTCASSSKYDASFPKALLTIFSYYATIYVLKL